MEFEWDPAKAEANLAKHGIDFRDAALLLRGPVLDRPSSYAAEPRRVAIGRLPDEREAAVIYTIREGRYRIISARRARENERRAYRQVHG